MIAKLSEIDVNGQTAGEDWSTPGIHRFSHRAMATIFDIFCTHSDREYARQAAWACFDLADRMEQDLSRFIENSDISRINNLIAGECVRVSRWTMECLQMARIAYLETSGAFDISCGSGLGELDLAPDDLRVRAKSDRVRLDLGGIGKGYAVDRIAEVLMEWDVGEALIHAGRSSVRALNGPCDAEGWPLTLSARAHGQCTPFLEIRAQQQVLSASGVLKGEHIWVPESRRRQRLRRAAWVSGNSRALTGYWQRAEELGATPVNQSPSAVAEIFSTAFLMLDSAEIEGCCEKCPGLEAWLIDNERNGAGITPQVTHVC